MSTTTPEDMLKRLADLERRLAKLEAKECARAKRRTPELKPARRHNAEPFVGPTKAAILEEWAARNHGRLVLDFTASEAAEWVTTRGHGDVEKNGKPTKGFIAIVSAALQLLGLRATKSNARRLFRVTAETITKWAGK